MKRLINNLLGKSDAQHGADTKQGMFPPGHFNSPVPDRDDVRAYIDARKPLSKEVVGVDLNAEGQLALLREYIELYAELPFPETEQSDCRYYYQNGWFSYSDAIFLYSFLRKHQPKRIIEVGSGFSSAVMLDTSERFLSERPEMTFIEPFADRLKSLFRSDDHEHVEVIEKKVQDVPADLFSTLESGDLLFIDSSHVLKCGSDLQTLLFDVVPRLPAGVFVHFHDIFYPFEYPNEWLKQGRDWNENYFLRAFLSFNSEWRILFFNTFAAYAFKDIIESDMPLCAKNAGGSLYLQRHRHPGG